MKLATILLLSFVPLFVSGQQYFEGRIQFTNEVQAYSKKVDVKKLLQIFGKGSTLHFKDGSFRHDYEGGTIEFDLYIRQSNRFYVKRRDNDTIFWHDCSSGGTPIKDLKVIKQQKSVLGILCDQLTIQYADHKRIEYYNSDSIQINPQWFAAFKRDDQHKIDAIEKSIFLRSETVYPLATVISRATSVNHATLSVSIFKIHGNAILLKKE